MDYQSLAHGQIQSKLWLCESLEPYIPNNSSVLILGCWYNILGFMLLTRNCRNILSITGIDIDPEAITIANKLCEAWMIGNDSKLHNQVADANTFDYHGYNVVINCSVEHMNSTEWFDRIDSDALVCLQTNNANDKIEEWKITNPAESFESFIAKYPLKQYIFRATKPIQYEHWGYSRYMIIGTK